MFRLEGTSHVHLSKQNSSPAGLHQKLLNFFQNNVHLSSPSRPRKVIHKLAKNDTKSIINDANMNNDLKSMPTKKDNLKRIVKAANLNNDAKLKSEKKDNTKSIVNDKDPSESNEKPSHCCLPPVLAKIYAAKKGQKSMSNTHCICYALNFEEQNGMKRKLGCLRVNQPTGMILKAQKERIGERTEYSIPNIKLPSVNEILEYTTVSDLLFLITVLASNIQET